MGVNGEINVVSLIDVMMLLMVIFMITAPIMQGGIDINLPKADAQPLDAKNGLVVSVDRRGRIFIDNDELSFREFAGSVKALAEKKGGRGVSVRADGAVEYQRVADVMGALTSAGITEIGLIFESKESR